MNARCAENRSDTRVTQPERQRQTRYQGATLKSLRALVIVKIVIMESARGHLDVQSPGAWNNPILSQAGHIHQMAVSYPLCVVSDPSVGFEELGCLCSRSVKSQSFPRLDKGTQCEL